MRHNGTNWKRIGKVATLLVRTDEGAKEVLIGHRIGAGPKGYTALVNGEMKLHDLDPKSAAFRECRERLGLRPVTGESVARITITEELKREIVTVHIIQSTEFDGELRVNGSEFKSIRFIPFEDIPWDRMAPEEECWIRRILLEERRFLVSIVRGDPAKTRKMRFKPLPKISART